MSTDEELGAGKAYTVGEDETAALVKMKPQQKNRLLLSRLRQASNIRSSGRLWNRKF